MQSLRLDWDADTAYPIEITRLKEHLRLLDAPLFDPLLNDVIVGAAVEWAESVMHRSILAKAHRWVLSDFPRSFYADIRLPRGKTQSVASIIYSNNNALTTLTGPTSAVPGTEFRENLRGDEGASLFPTYNGTWPSVDTQAPEPVLITFTAGWTAATIPLQIKHAIAWACSDFLEISGASDMMPSTDLDAKTRFLSNLRIA